MTRRVHGLRILELDEQILRIRKGLSLQRADVDLGRFGHRREEKLDPPTASTLDLLHVPLADLRNLPPCDLRMEGHQYLRPTATASEFERVRKRTGDGLGFRKSSLGGKLPSKNRPLGQYEMH